MHINIQTRWQQICEHGLGFLETITFQYQLKDTHGE